MSDLRTEKIDESDLSTIMSDDICFSGSLKFRDSLMIKGRFKGDIRSKGTLYIDENSLVDARIEVDAVYVKGKIIGDVYAYTKVELASTACVDGDIVSPNIFMDIGSQFNGKCIMKSPTEVLAHEN